jgi:hypothetical protein
MMTQKIIFIVLAICSLFSTNQLTAKNANHNSSLGKKIYIQQDHIELADNEILVHLDNGAFVAQSLNKDGNGFYVYSKQLVIPKRSLLYFCHYCNACGFANLDHVRRHERQCPKNPANR